MSKRSGVRMTVDEVNAHYARLGKVSPLANAPAVVEAVTPVPKAVKMSVPEKEMDLMLLARKSKGEILEYRYQGLSLAWGKNPVTGKLMRYKCDFFVIEAAFRMKSHLADVVIIEVKGPHIWPKDLIRFRGCRAEWPMFRFELHQRDSDGGWKRLE